MRGEDERVSDQEEQPGNSPPTMDGARIISYNFNEDERPGGMKVRAKIRVVSGKQAEAAEAIRELLIWVRQQRRKQQQEP